jgi:hypothetical protein
LNVTQPTVGEWVEEKLKLALFFHAAPESRQHFDVWLDGKKSNEFENLPPDSR